jgi:hypothetical protein
MKIFFLTLSDTNVGLIITGIFGIITLILTLVLIPMLNKLLARQTVLSKQVNGMKDELVQATKALGLAVGKAQGREQLKAELGLTEIEVKKIGKTLNGE